MIIMQTKQMGQTTTLITYVNKDILSKFHFKFHKGLNSVQYFEKMTVKITV
jgi:hypothetical protein